MCLSAFPRTRNKIRQLFLQKRGTKRNMYYQKISLPVVKASFILIAQKGGSAEGGRVPRSYELKAIRKKGAMVMS